MNKDIKDYIIRKKSEYQACIEKYQGYIKEYTEKAQEYEDKLKETQAHLRMLESDEGKLNG